MSLFNELFDNHPLLIASIALFFAQGYKVVDHLIATHRLDFRLCFSTGGMPSSHSAFVSSLAVAVGLKEGFNSTFFAICLVFALIVIRDALGVRQTVSHHAHLLHRMVSDFFEEAPTQNMKRAELSGHTPIQVFMHEK